MAVRDLSEEQQHAADAAQLAALGYKQQLTRVLGIGRNFSVGFTYLSPLVGVYSLFAYGLATGGPAMFWSIPIVVVGQGLVLLVFAETASQFPIAGGVFQWTKRLVGPRYGWFAGWMYTWALLVTIASVAFAIAGFAGPLIGYPVNSTTTIVTAVVAIFFAGGVNLLGIRRLSFVTTIGVIAEVLGTVALGAYLLIFHRHNDWGAITHSFGAGGTGSYAGAFLAALLFSVWIFYGFEACGDIAEEVKNPSRKIPGAMGMTLGVGAIASIILTLGLILAIPNIGAVISGKDADPIGTVFSAALGTVGAKIAFVLILIGFISCTTAIQAAATRLVYSYGRDGMIVGARLLSRVHPKFHMPPGAILVATIIPAIMVLMPSATVARIITFAVVGIYIGFQSVMLAALIGRARGWRPSGAFRLGVWAWPVNILALGYGVAVIVILCIKTPPAGTSFFDVWLVPISVGIVFVAGVIYVLIANPTENVQEEARADQVTSTEAHRPPVEA